ncbi:TolC family protein [Mucilaginibacter gossypiicola]|nr:TolC family protein [Mucilaginibacter gossypiicola]
MLSDTGHRLSLTAVWHLADIQNRTNQVKSIQVNQLQENILDAKAERLPELNATGGFEEASDLPIYTNGVLNAPKLHNIVHTRYRLGVDGTLNIYNGNKTNLKIEEQKTLKELEVIRQQATVADIRLLAAAYYLDLKKSYLFKALVEKNIADQERQLAKISVFLQQGAILKSDLLRARLKLSNQRVSLIQIQNDILIGTQKLNILIGRPDNDTIIPIDSLQTDQSDLKPYDEYLNGLPQVYNNRISDKEKSLSEIRLKNVKANVGLKVGLYGNFQYAYPENFLYPYYANVYSLGVAGIKVSYPLSGYYLNAHKQKAAMLEVQKQQLLSLDVQDKVRQRITEAYVRLTEARTKVTVAHDNVSVAAENYRIVKNTYFNQASLITDLLDADVQLLQANFDLVSSEVTAQLQYYQLQNTLGTL